MLPHFNELSGNPSSIHSAGHRARTDIDHAREILALILACDTDEIYFTSGGTESDNWAIKGVVDAARGDGKRGNRRRIVTSSIEHHAVWHTCDYAHELGFDVQYVPVDNVGCIRLDVLEDLVDDETLIVSVMHANNETGRVQPVRAIADIAKRFGVLFHVDAVQSFGKLKWQLEDLGADLISLSAHKINGPKGVGALYARTGTPLNSIAHGGMHEAGRRAGTENVAGIVGFGKAADLAHRELEVEAERLGALRDQLEAGILSHLDEIFINGAEMDANPESVEKRVFPERLPNTSNIAFRGVEAEALILGLDLEGIAVSSGSACTAGTTDPSHVLLAMGLEPRLASSSARFSLGWGNTSTEVDYCIQILPQIVNRLRDLSTEVST